MKRVNEKRKTHVVILISFNQIK